MTISFRARLQGWNLISATEKEQTPRKCEESIFPNCNGNMIRTTFDFLYVYTEIGRYVCIHSNTHRYAYTHACSYIDI